MLTRQGATLWIPAAYIVLNADDETAFVLVLYTAALALIHACMHQHCLDLFYLGLINKSRKLG